MLVMLVEATGSNSLFRVEFNAGLFGDLNGYICP